MHITQWVFRAAQVNGGGVAVHTPQGKRSWGETADRIRRMAGGLEHVGLKRNDNVAILSQNSPLYLESIFAIPLMGARMVPLNIRWAVPELVYSLGDSASRALLFDQAFSDTANKLRQENLALEHFIYMGSAAECPEWAQPLEDLTASAQPRMELVESDDNIAGIFYTGGTTGFPKGVVQTHMALYGSSISIVAVSEADESSVYLHAAPMFHMADMIGTFLTTMVAGQHAFIPAFEPAAFLRAMVDQQINETLIVPAMVQQVFDHPDFDPTRLGHWQRLAYGGSPMPEGLVRRVMKALPELRLMQVYGQTELAPIATLLLPEDHSVEPDKAYRLRSAGRVTFSDELRILGENGEQMPNGEVGEVCVSGPNAMRGYLNKPEETAKSLVNGWVHTGDAGYLDEDGYLFIVDRTKDMIVSGGENVYSSEVESAVSTHSCVAQVAVVGIPDEKWGEAVHAIVVPKAGEERDADAIIAHCHERIAGYKCPKSVEFREEPLPLSGAGKVLKRELRAPHWEGRERQVN